MSTFILFARGLIITVIVIVLFSGISFGQGKVGVIFDFLTQNNSARCIALGGCSVNLINGESAMFNPGAMGLYYLGRNFSISFPSSTKVWPDIADDILLKSFGFGGGVTFRQLFPSLKGRFDASVSFSYSRLKFGFGKIYITDYLGNLAGYVDPENICNYFTVGAGFNYYLNVGIGLTFKDLEHNTNPHDNVSLYFTNQDGTAIDYGVLLEIPIMEFIPHKIDIESSGKYKLHFDLTPSFAYTKMNIGDEIAVDELSGIQYYDIPKTARTGFLLRWSANVNEAEFLSLLYVTECEKDLIRTNKDDLVRYGFEFGMFGLIDIRWGEEDDKNEYFGDPTKTKGFGIKLSGLLKWLTIFNVGSKGFVDYLIKNFDMTYDNASIKIDGVNTDRKYIKITLSI
jgi:hypothetical protein